MPNQRSKETEDKCITLKETVHSIIADELPGH